MVWLLHVFSSLLVLYVCFIMSTLCVAFVVAQESNLLHWAARRKPKSLCNSSWALAKNAHAQAVILSNLFFRRIPSQAQSLSFFHDRSSHEAQFVGSLHNHAPLPGGSEYFPKIITARKDGVSMTMLLLFKIPYLEHVRSTTVLPRSLSCCPCWPCLLLLLFLCSSQ